ncbi:MAG: hypothetical protein PVF27_10255, partial [Gemmatimonadales bacterium]
QRTLDENLRYLNERLRAYAFEHAGQETYSHVTLRGDRVIFEVTNVRAGTEVTNVYDAATAEVQPGRIRVRGMGSHIEITVPSSGDVTSRMRCVNPNGTSNEWSLPSTSQLVLHMRPGRAEADELKAVLATLLRQAQEGLAVT